MTLMLMLTIIFLIPIYVLPQNWVIEPVDSSGFVYDCSIAVDTMNYPHIAYCYRQDLGGNWASYWLKYARWNGIDWEFQPAESIAAYNLGAPIFKFSKLCIDNQNNPHIAYCKDSVPYKYAYYNGNSWQISTIESCYADISTNSIDMVLTDDGIPHISYPFVNFSNYTRGIRYAFKSSDSWIIQTVWEENRISSSNIFTTAIDLDRSGYPAIAFSQWSYSTTDTGYLFCARFNGQNWMIDTVHHIENEMYYVFSLKVNNPERIHIFYKRDFGVFYAVTEGDSWTIEFIDMNGLFEAGGDMILEGDKPNVVYSSVEDPLIYAYKFNTLWNYEIIDHYYEGLYPSIAQDNRSRLHVSYIRVGFTTWYLCYAQRNSPAIAEKEVQSIVESKALIEIYQNPARNYLAIRLPQTADRQMIKIFDVSGKLVKEEKVTNLQGHKQEVRISLKGINPGIYFLQLGKEVKKFIVAK
jgi:hypothetical protein